MSDDSTTQCLLFPGIFCKPVVAQFDQREGSSDGGALASQPTLSRFENGVGVKELYRSGEFLAESVIRRHARRLRHRTDRVTIDLDPTDDPTHGAQQLSFFNGHYDTWCYLPMMNRLNHRIKVAFSDACLQEEE